MSKGKKKDVNPNKIPRTEADVKDAFGKGVQLGLKLEDLIWLNVILDKYEEDVDLEKVWQNIQKLQHEIAEGRVSWADIRNSLKEDYLIQLDYPRGGVPGRERC